MLGVLILLLPASFGFRLPERRVDTKVDTDIDSHSEIHDSLLNSTLQSFNFHLNLISLSFTTSIFILVLIILLARRQNLAIQRVSSQLVLQKKKIEMLLRNNGE